MKSEHGKYRRDDVGNNNEDWNSRQTIGLKHGQLTEKDHARKSEREGHGVADDQTIIVPEGNRNERNAQVGALVLV